MREDVWIIEQTAADELSEVGGSASVEERPIYSEAGHCVGPKHLDPWLLPDEPRLVEELPPLGLDPREPYAKRCVVVPEKVVAQPLEGLSRSRHPGSLSDSEILWMTAQTLSNF
jgi:hypothetical protein